MVKKFKIVNSYANTNDRTITKPLTALISILALCTIFSQESNTYQGTRLPGVLNQRVKPKGTNHADCVGQKRVNQPCQPDMYNIIFFQYGLIEDANIFLALILKKKHSSCMGKIEVLMYLLIHPCVPEYSWLCLYLNHEIIFYVGSIQNFTHVHRK